MNFLDKLEKKWGKFAIPNLMLYITLGNAIVFLLEMITRISISSLLSFNIEAILHGQIWRILTFVFIPQDTGSIIFFFFVVYLYYSIGGSLEHAWGTFKFNVFYISGALFTALGLIILYFLKGYSFNGDTYYINLSLFLAYAVMFPDVEFLLFFILPVKVKYLALLDAVLLGASFITGGIFTKILIIVSLLNFFLFFGKHMTGRSNTTTQRNFKKQQRDLKKGPTIHVAFHKCTVCGKTELTDPDMEFRYCSQCHGNYEYCMDHLKNHEHK